jgi:hypothetical protein
MEVDRIYEWFDTTGFKIYAAYTHKFINFEEFDTPIQTELGTLFLYSLRSSYIVEYNTKIVRNNFQSLDTQFQMIPGVQI